MKILWLPNSTFKSLYFGSRKYKKANFCKLIKLVINSLCFTDFLCWLQTRTKIKVVLYILKKAANKVGF